MSLSMTNVHENEPVLRDKHLIWSLDWSDGRGEGIF